MNSIKKIDMQKLIDGEHGINFCKNVNLNGYTVYSDASFISFRFLQVNNKNIVYIDYIYVTNKKKLLDLFAWCINFWSGMNAEVIYLSEHMRKANYIQKYLPLLGFNIIESERKKPWKYEWTSTNGFSENQMLEAIT